MKTRTQKASGLIGRCLIGSALALNILGCNSPQKYGSKKPYSISPSGEILRGSEAVKVAQAGQGFYVPLSNGKVAYYPPGTNQLSRSNVLRFEPKIISEEEAKDIAKKEFISQFETSTQSGFQNFATEITKSWLSESSYDQRKE